MHGQQLSARRDDLSRVVAIGGGTGLPNLLSGLRRQRSDLLEISAIVTTFDDGGSSGMLRKQYDIPALGDIRRCLIALAQPGAVSDAFTEAMNHRFDTSSDVRGHSLGNLILASWTMQNGDVRAAIRNATEIMDCCGQVIPVAIEPANLRAELTDGTWIESETAIDTRDATEPQIKRVALDRLVAANPEAISAINDADLIVLGPGDLYTSVVPNLLPEGIATAVLKSHARVVYVCNIRNKPAETSNFNASGYVGVINSYIGASRIDAVLVNEVPRHDISEDAVRLDAALEDSVGEVIARDFADATNPGRHDSETLAAEVVRLLEKSGS